MSVTFDCPRCKNVSTRVSDSRAGATFYGVRRRRRCEKCDHKFTTREVLETAPMLKALQREDKARTILKRLNLLYSEDPRP